MIESRAHRPTAPAPVAAARHADDPESRVVEYHRASPVRAVEHELVLDRQRNVAHTEKSAPAGLSVHVGISTWTPGWIERSQSTPRTGTGQAEPTRVRWTSRVDQLGRVRPRPPRCRCAWARPSRKSLIGVKWPRKEAARRSLGMFLADVCDQQRLLHSALAYLIPVEFEATLMPAVTTALVEPA